MQLTHGEVLVGLTALGALVLTARVLGELMHRYGLPVVVGELLTGVLLGPTVLGALAPGAYAGLFPTQGGAAVLLDGLTILAITLFFFVAGLEVELSSVWRLGRAALSVGLGGMALPFALAFAVAWWLPTGAIGAVGLARPLPFALFLGTVLSVTAVAVVARVLMDLNLYRSDLGMVLVAGALLNDLVAWIVVSLIIGALGAQRTGLQPATAIALILAFSALMLTVVRWGLRRALPWVQAHTSWPGGVLGLGLGLALLAAAVTEAIGVHPIFGAFMAGVALGDAPHLRERSRFALRQFVSIFFAPLFFASIGLRVDFLATFDPLLFVVLLPIAVGGKLLGAGLSARWAGMQSRLAWGAGVGMNARGSMDLILALLGLQLGLFTPQLFVTLVVVALVSALACGPVLQRVLRVQAPRRFLHHLSPRAFVARLASREALGAIDELAVVAADAAGLDAQAVSRAVRARERVMHTGLGRRLAVPHARLPGLARPVVALGLSEAGVDFDAPDDLPTRIVVLLLVPQEDPTAQLELLQDVIRVLGNPAVQPGVLAARTYLELAARVRSSGEEGTET